ncbi:MAG: CIA30 family protein, partial [Elusimicrobiota bacterium]|nr:CIA30 family protein [Elusimicrobiota bacterium]
DWQVQGDGGLKVSVSSSGYFDSSCMIFSYNLTEREWVQIWKDFSVKNFSYGDTLKFWFYGEGEKNNLEIKLEDDDGSVFVKTLYGVTDTTSWSEVKIPFDEFKYGWGGKDKILDLTRIKKISFGVTKYNGGEGYIIIDNIELFSSTSAVKILDNFDDLNNTNNFGGTNYAWGSTCTVVYVSTEKYSGTGAVEVSYDVTAGSTVYAGFILHLNKQQIRPATYLSFYVKTAGSGCQNFRVKFEDYDNNRNWGKEVKIEDYTPLSSQWQRVDIPLADFDDFISTYTVHPGGMKLNFVFGYNFGPPFSGKVYIDEIKFYIPDLPEGATAKIIDTMDELVNKLCSWSTYGDALINIESVNGYKNKGIKLNYDFTFAKDSYGVMERNMSLNFSNFNIIQLRYKGQTNNNNFEFKLTDSDGTCYWKKIFNLPDSTDWQTIKIPIRELSLFMKEKEDANSDLDLKNITKLYIVLSKSSYDKENKGVVYFDNLELSIEPDYEVEKKYIEKFEVVNNPFSPNGDGVKDTVRFVYKLKDYSTVKLEIFTLRGERVKVFNEGEKLPSQEHTIEWNGRDDDKNLLRNGIYIYRFSIKTLDGKEEEIKHIIGIIK